MTSPDQQDNLYLVYTSASVDTLSETPDLQQLNDNLFLVRSSDTRSGLYHDIKRKLQPQTLLVAPLSDLPKFKGMHQGATKGAQRLRT